MDKTVLDAVDRMESCVHRFREFLRGVRTDHLSPKIVGTISVSCHGGTKPLHQLASTVSDGRRAMAVTVFDGEMVSAVEKALAGTNLGLNLTTSGTRIRITVPPLTEESRLRSIKLVRLEAERCKVSVRQIRRDVNLKIKLLLRERSITECTDRNLRTRIQLSTDRCAQEVDHLLRSKEMELSG